MLADPKSEAVTNTFAYQWLHLQNLKEWSPDLFFFPDFDRSLSQSMVRETELLFDNVMRQDRPVTGAFVIHPGRGLAGSRWS